jgi:hypothetical protein
MRETTPTTTHSCNLSQWVDKMQPVDTITVDHLLLILKESLSSLRLYCKSHRYHRYILPRDLCVTYHRHNPTHIKNVTLYDTGCTNTNRCNRCIGMDEYHAHVVNFFCSPRSLKRYFSGNKKYEILASSSSNAMFSIALCMLSTLNGARETRKWLPPTNTFHHPTGAEYQLQRFGWYHIKVEGRQIYKKKHKTFIRTDEQHAPENGYSFLFAAPFARFKRRSPVAYTKIMEMLCNILREDEEHRLDHNALLYRVQLIRPSNDLYINIPTPVPRKRNLDCCPDRPRKKMSRGRPPYSPPGFKQLHQTEAHFNK